MSHIRNSHINLSQPYFWTPTINNWHHLLADDEMKMKIIRSLQWLKQKDLITLYAYVIMPNHLHFIWSLKGKNGKESPHGSLLKFTAHSFKILLQEKDAFSLEKFSVNAANKSYEFWKRDSFAFPLYSKDVILQKIEYIHNNPVAKNWQLATTREDYRFSSSAFYLTGLDEFNILTHIGEIL